MPLNHGPRHPTNRFYYDCLMKPNAKSVTTALRKVKDLQYSVIANGHGPVLRFNVPELIGHYGSWSSSITKGAVSVAGVGECMGRVSGQCRTWLCMRLLSWQH